MHQPCPFLIYISLKRNMINYSEILPNLYKTIRKEGFLGGGGVLNGTKMQYLKNSLRKC